MKDHKQPLQKQLPLIDNYFEHLTATLDWLLVSIEKGKGGSSAYFSPLLGWGSPYPETSGYIITTLLDASQLLNKEKYYNAACKVGEWLLKLQSQEGWWPGGLYKEGKCAGPSIFNTGQIIDGMCALAIKTKSEAYRKAALKGANWLKDGVDKQGVWHAGNYMKGVNPSYYSQVAWPMLMAWKLGGNDEIKKAAVLVLQRILKRRTEKGLIKGWGFDPKAPSFTHTIAYTLRGMLESAIILEDWDTYGSPCELALERLARKSELTNGRLPGAYRDDWRPINWYTCLTGNVQIALCLLRLDSLNPDLRLVNSSVKLIDRVSKTQRLKGSLGVKGAVAGSQPIFGKYMFMRYPNWAAKYHADAIISLIKRLSKEIA
ncbi:MAG: hypothetical protein CMM02_05130 [Rhodopirellula sp.]|nr:hypothetical protein [Rhodopirellula sp.]